MGCFLEYELLLILSPSVIGVIISTLYDKVLRVMKSIIHPAQSFFKNLTYKLVNRLKIILMTSGNYIFTYISLRIFDLNEA